MIRFDLVNPKALEWAKSHAAENTPNIREECRAAIRTLITRAFTEGIAPPKLATLIMPLLDLTEEEQRQVEVHRNDISRKGYTGVRFENAIQRRRSRLLRARAETIARTEIQRASNQGQLELWREAASGGLLDPARTWRQWIATPGDERTCETCLEMHGKKAPFNEPFATPTGPAWGPPLHEGCRCCSGLSFE